jgi:hypothetical protein
MKDETENENKLNALNREIKCILMNLLNCNGVKTDERYRTWVQTRLMDTERKLSSHRRQSCNRTV